MSTGRRPARAWYASLRPVAAEGHEVLLLEGGDQYFPALCAAVDEAAHSVFLETYIFEDDAAGRRVAAALARAARRGVAVHLTVDGYGTPALTGEVRDALRSSGVRVEIFRPERRRLSLDRRRLRRLHRKIAVIDGRTAFVGGINILDDRFDPNHGPLDAPRLDFAVRVRGPVVANILLAAQRMWWALGLIHRALGVVRGPRGGALPSGAPNPVPRDMSTDTSADARPADARPADARPTDARPVGGLRAMFVLRDNFRFRRAIEQQYLLAIHGARREVLIATAYFFPGARFRKALIEAAARGVRVRLLLQGRAEYRLPHYASHAFYDELLAAGVEIVEYRRSFLHAKVAVIDDAATVGSSNIDPFSLLVAREANLFVFDAAFAARLRARILHALEQGGVAVQAAVHARRGWLVRILNALARTLLRAALAFSGEGDGY